MTADQIAHSLEPLKEVDAKSLDEIANTLKESKSRQKRAVGVFLDRINRYRLEPTKPDEAARKQHMKTGLRDLSE
jgi:hypothetical protein